MNPSTRRSLLPLATLALALGTGAVHAQETPEDWPCVQRLVPEVSAATLWPVPFEPELLGTWREDEDAVALARYLGDLEAVDAEALAAIDRYANAVPEPERRDALTRLADGVVSVANERRSLYLDGIRRYTRQQIAIAEQIESTLNRLAELDDAAGQGDVTVRGAPASEGRTLSGAEAERAAGTVAGGAGEDRASIEETLFWHERLYDQRERAIRSLCERPVSLEETLSEVLRELSYRLPDA